MATVNVYVSDALKEAMRKHPDINWSEVAQVAFHNAINRKILLAEARAVFTQVVQTFEEVCELPNGYTLFREENGVGGHTYWCDDVDGGVMVWDTSLTDSSTLLAAIVEETRAVLAERRAASDGPVTNTDPNNPGEQEN